MAPPPTRHPSPDLFYHPYLRPQPLEDALPRRYAQPPPLSTAYDVHSTPTGHFEARAFPRHQTPAPPRASPLSPLFSHASDPPAPTSRPMRSINGLLRHRTPPSALRSGNVRDHTYRQQSTSILLTPTPTTSGDTSPTEIGDVSEITKGVNALVLRADHWRENSTVVAGRKRSSSPLHNPRSPQQGFRLGPPSRPLIGSGPHLHRPSSPHASGRPSQRPRHTRDDDPPPSSGLAQNDPQGLMTWIAQSALPSNALPATPTAPMPLFHGRQESSGDSDYSCLTNPSVRHRRDFQHDVQEQEINPGLFGPVPSPPSSHIANVSAPSRARVVSPSPAERGGNEGRAFPQHRSQMPRYGARRVATPEGSRVIANLPLSRLRPSSAVPAVPPERSHRRTITAGAITRAYQFAPPLPGFAPQPIGRPLTSDPSKITRRETSRLASGIDVQAAVARFDALQSNLPTSHEPARPSSHESRRHSSLIPNPVPNRHQNITPTVGIGGHRISSRPQVTSEHSRPIASLVSGTLANSPAIPPNRLTRRDHEELIRTQRQIYDSIQLQRRLPVIGLIAPPATPPPEPPARTQANDAARGMEAARVQRGGGIEQFQALRRPPNEDLTDNEEDEWANDPDSPVHRHRQTFDLGALAGAQVEEQRSLAAEVQRINLAVDTAAALERSIADAATPAPPVPILTSEYLSARPSERNRRPADIAKDATVPDMPPMSPRSQAREASAREEDLICAICQEIMAVPIQLQPCDHELCGACALQWIQAKRDERIPPNCPHCRGRMFQVQWGRNSLVKTEAVRIFIENAGGSSWSGYEDWQARKEIWEAHLLVTPNIFNRWPDPTPRRPALDRDIVDQVLERMRQLHGNFELAERPVANSGSGIEQTRPRLFSSVGQRPTTVSQMTDMLEAARRLQLTDARMIVSLTLDEITAINTLLPEAPAQRSPEPSSYDYEAYDEDDEWVSDDDVDVSYPFDAVNDFRRRSNQARVVMSAGTAGDEAMPYEVVPGPDGEPITRPTRRPGYIRPARTWR